MSTNSQTVKQQLVEERLGRSLKHYLADRRRKHLSWRAISGDLLERTGVSVSDVALRQWDAALNPLPATQPAAPAAEPTVEAARKAS